MTTHPHILGAILAGGAARRMFPDRGGDKGLNELGGVAMLSHVIERLRPQVGQLILNANGDPARFAAFGLDVVPDVLGPDQGPLAGLYAVMDWAGRQEMSFDKILTVSTDVPFLPPGLVDKLAAAIRSQRPVIAQSSGRLHPAIGLWPVSLKDAVAQALAEGRRGFEGFATANEAIAVGFPFSDIAGETVDPFFNVNTPDDLAAARRLLAGQT